jgi:phage shock protein A
VAGEERVAELEAENEALRAQVSQLVGAIGELKSRVADLESQLGRTSKNSSTPPSRDGNETSEEAKLNH